jgi:hypothetical protein
MVDPQKYQLVVQFDASTHKEFEELSPLEDLLRDNLSDNALVDGWDFGLGDYNIFIHTNEPNEVFADTQKIIEAHRRELPFRAGYRDFDEDYYVVLWPASLKSFKVL